MRRSRNLIMLVLLGIVGWALCGAIVFIGRGLTSMQTTLVVHAAGAPLIFAAISWIYFTRFGATSPLVTALAFVGIVVFLDVFLVALIIERSMEMFASLLGTWIPWALIFLSTYLTGVYLTKRSSTPQAA
ncbi:MAG TPA: hypothetical protein VLL77_10610 [Anaerolineales bacterium]|nr:hypothetical protein [Anaerolineales bacterium]